MIRFVWIHGVFFIQNTSICISNFQYEDRPFQLSYPRKVGVDSVVWFWNFVIYSFFGFLLEIAFARGTGGRMDRKCLLLLPLCPVYGLGGSAILLLTPLVEHSPVLLFVLGGATATVVEYVVAAWYEDGLGVSFWDYTGLPGNVRGRVCLPFSIAWGVLSLGLVYWVHPVVQRWEGAIPLPVTLAMIMLVGADLVVSGIMMKRTGDRRCLQWYRK